MSAGRPRKVDPGTLYTFAHLFYWDFRRLSEGTSRYRLDQKEYNRLIGDSSLEAEYVQISEDDRANHERYVAEEIRNGRFIEWIRSQRPDFVGRELEVQKRERLRDIEDGLLLAKQASFRNWAAEQATKSLKIPGEEDAIKVLLNPHSTAEQIREVCKDAFMIRTIEVEPGVSKDVEGFPAWPIHAGSSFPGYLSQYAEQYVAALRDRRFPRCDVSARPSTRLKQFWFLSRALAGALFGVTTRTAINLVGSLRPEETLELSRYAKPKRKRTRRKYKLRHAS